LKCPLYYAQLREQKNGSTSDRGDCLKEECAQWDNTNKNCAIYQLSLSMRHLVAILDLIKIKMPKETKGK